MKTLERSILYALVALACVPFSRVINIDIQVAKISIAEVIQLYILLVAIVLNLFRGINLRRSALFIVAVVGALFAFLYSIALNDVVRGDAVRHLRFFLPFLVSVAILATKIYADTYKFLLNISIAVSLSAVIAMIFHLFFNDIVSGLLSADENIVHMVAEGGRMYWDAGSISLFVIVGFVITKRKIYLALLILVVTATLLTQSRTLLISLVLIYVACEFVLKKKFILTPIILIFLTGISLFIFSMVADEKMQRLFADRFGENDASTEYERAVVINRVPLYIQYSNIINDSFPFGQGLGKPLYEGIMGERFFTTDISILSFLLPFGLIGVFIWMWYVIKCWHLFSIQTAKENNLDSKVFRVLIITLLLTSLNLDVFSRNIIVIYLAYVAVIFHSARSVTSSVDR